MPWHGVGDTVASVCGVLRPWPTRLGAGTAASTSSPTPVGPETTAGVASQYGAVSLAPFVLVAVGAIYLWWRLR